ncbi:MAG: magnesium chelatase ATPase subunit D, partial [Caulobacteraceae bacterium]|nr:magnesium chelatase ATPase subunit D [Caulobacter sp.]
MSDHEPRSLPDDAGLAACLLALDPRLGLRLRAAADPVRDAWIENYRAMLPSGTPWRRLPPGCSVRQLDGGLDLAATLLAGRPIETPGFIDAASGGVLIVPSAERLQGAVAASLARCVDMSGPPGLRPFATLALDEGRVDDDVAPAALSDRLAMSLDLRGCRVTRFKRLTVSALARAQARLAQVECSTEALEALCAAAAMFGIPGLRAPLQALAIAKASAALAGRRRVAAEDVAVAARLGLGPRARTLPVAEEAPAETSAGRDQTADAASQDAPGESDGEMGDHVAELRAVSVEAARATLPDDVLASLMHSTRGGMRAIVNTRTRGHAAAPNDRGRPVDGDARQPARGSASVDVVATLRAAIPFQQARGREQGGRLRLRSSDLRYVRRRAARRTTTVFAVDAS